MVFASIVLTAFHYTDNAINIDSYGPVLAFFTTATVFLTWSLFTALGIAAYLFYRNQRYKLANPLLFAYSFAGLIDLAHFVTISPAALTTRGLISVLIDLAIGTAVLVVAIRSILARRKGSALDKAEKPAGESGRIGALQRARAALEARLPAGDRERAQLPHSPRERELVGRFADAVEGGEPLAAQTDIGR